MISSFLLSCPHGHEMTVCLFQAGTVPAEAVLGCLEIGRRQGEFANTCLECGQPGGDWCEVPTRLENWEQMSETFSESVKIDLKKPRCCLVVSRQADGSGSIKTLIIRLIPGGDKNN